MERVVIDEGEGWRGKLVGDTGGVWTARDEADPHPDGQRCESIEGT